MKKGFTMIELLAVIAVLSILVILTFPLVISIVKKGNSKIDKAEMVFLESAIDTCISEGKCASCLQEANSSCTVKIKDLLENNYLKNKMLVNILEDDIVLVSYDNEKNKTIIVDENLKKKYIVCKNSKTLTYNAGILYHAEEKYREGTEYKCDPGDGRFRTFYVISDNSNNTVTLLMAFNYGGKTTSENSKNYLNKIITNKLWPAVSSISTLHSSYAFNFDYYKTQIGCSAINCVDSNSNNNPSYDLSGVIEGYWLDNNKVMTSSGVIEVSLDESSKYGFRPLITVEKSRFAFE